MFGSIFNWLCRWRVAHAWRQAARTFRQLLGRSGASWRAGRVLVLADNRRCEGLRACQYSTTMSSRHIACGGRDNAEYHITSHPVGPVDHLLERASSSSPASCVPPHLPHRCFLSETRIVRFIMWWEIINRSLKVKTPHMTFWCELSMWFHHQG